MEDENLSKNKVKNTITLIITVMIVISLILLAMQAGIYIYTFATRGNEKEYYYSTSEINGFSSYCYTGDKGLYCRVDIEVNQYEKNKEVISDGKRN